MAYQQLLLISQSKPRIWQERRFAGSSLASNSLDSEISVVAEDCGLFRLVLCGGLDYAIEFEAQLEGRMADGFTADEMAKLKQGAIDIGAAI